MLQPNDMGNVKTCNTCKETKSIKEFYRQPTGLMGRVGSCKTCRRERQKRYYKENREQVLQRGKNNPSESPERKRARAKKFKELNPDYWKEYYKQNREIRIAANTRYLKRHPERAAFYARYRYALQTGKLQRDELCNICGSKKATDGHHFTYDNPLKVTWVCKGCHLDIHKKHKIPARTA